MTVMDAEDYFHGLRLDTLPGYDALNLWPPDDVLDCDLTFKSKFDSKLGRINNGDSNLFDLDTFELPLLKTEEGD